MSDIDSRIMQIGVEVGGVLRVYSEGAMTANIVKTGDPTQNVTTLTLTGLARDVRNQLLTETSPYNPNYTAKRVTVSAGRASTGAFLLYSGDITRSTASQPPDSTITLTAMTLNFAKTVMSATSFIGATPLSVIAKSVAAKLSLVLTFQATDRNIGNFSYTGSNAKLVDKLGEIGGVDAYVDDNKLIVKDATTPLTNITHTLDENSGMVGVPELTDMGVRVKCMLDPNAQLGGTLQLTSAVNPSLSGSYTIYSLAHVVTTREEAFYTVLDCFRQGRVDTVTAGFPLLLRQ